MYNRIDVLQGYKILDLSRIFTGPFVSQILSDLGATVIKVEPPGGDDTRSWGPPFIDDDNSISTYFCSLNRNKKSIELDLTTDEDYSVLTHLTNWADIIIENFSPGITKKLKIDYETLRKHNDNLIYLTITGFGTTGPYCNHPSYDIIAQSESGIMSITGSSEEIAKVGIPIGDIAAGMYGVIGILTALINKQNHSGGIHVETDLFSSLVSWMTYQGMNAYFNDAEHQPKPLGTAHPNIVPYQSFLCKDNQWISISIGNDGMWQKFKEFLLDIRINSNRIIELDEVKFNTNAGRVNHRDELIPKLQSIFLEFTSHYWQKHLSDRDIAVGQVNTLDNLFNHSQIKHNGQLKILHNAENKKLPFFITPLSFSSSNVIDISLPPRLNQDNLIIRKLVNNDE